MLAYHHPIPDPFLQTLARIDGDVGSIVVGYDYSIKLYKKDVLADEWVAPPQAHEWSRGDGAEAILDSVYQIQLHWLECWQSNTWPTSTSGRDNLETLKLVEASYMAAKK